jgi:hypothetical protein
MTPSDHVERMGRESVPVVPFDDFVPQPELLAEDAAMLGFAPMERH